MTIMELFMECIGKLSATIVDSDMCNFIILGDFNSAVDTPFESELVEFCSHLCQLTLSVQKKIKLPIKIAENVINIDVLFIIFVNKYLKRCSI